MQPTEQCVTGLKKINYFMSFHLLSGFVCLQTVENAMCILRNLSYRLENEVDPQEGADDDLDFEWERELKREIEEAQQQQAAPRRRRGGFLLLCFSPRTNEAPRRSIPRLSPPRNLDSPGRSHDHPDRSHDHPGRSHDHPGRSHDHPGRSHDHPGRSHDHPG